MRLQNNLYCLAHYHPVVHQWPLAEDEWIQFVHVDCRHIQMEGYMCTTTDIIIWGEYKGLIWMLIYPFTWTGGVDCWRILHYLFLLEECWPVEFARSLLLSPCRICLFLSASQPPLPPPRSAWGVIKSVYVCPQAKETDINTYAISYEGQTQICKYMYV